MKTLYNFQGTFENSIETKELKSKPKNLLKVLANPTDLLAETKSQKGLT